MQFITRVLIVLAVLGGLGYGSYAFGKYVLSARLFGPQGNAPTTTTASTGGDAGQAPSNVDIEVLPVPQPTVNAGISETPDGTPQPSATPDERVEITPSQTDGGGSTRNPTRNRAQPTPRPRRRRRARPTPRPQPKPRPTSVPQVQAPPAREQNVDPPARDNSDNDAPRAATPRRSEPVEVPTRPRRERERRTDIAPRVETPRAETPRAEAPRVRPREEAPRRREPSSPVPVPEGALGGGSSSPVPVPG